MSFWVLTIVSLPGLLLLYLTVSVGTPGELYG